MPSVFPFVEKEGKFFAPVVYNVPRFIVQNGAIVEDTANPKLEAGAKGVFAKVRMTSNETGEAELFAVNTEWFPSSN